MNTIDARFAVLLLLATGLAAAMALATDGPPDWTAIGPTAEGATDLLMEHARERGLFLTTAGGYWYYDPRGLACTRALGDVAGELVASADTGLTWQPVAGHGHHDLTDLVAWWNDEYYVAGDAGVRFTPDGGVTWHDRNAGLPPGAVRGLWREGPLIVVPGKDTAPPEDTRDYLWQLLAVMDDGVYVTRTDTVAWRRVLDDPSPRRVVRQLDPYGLPAHVFVVTGDGRLLYGRDGVWDWEDWSGDLAGLDIVGVAPYPPQLFVATANHGAYVTEFNMAASPAPVPAPPPTLRAAPNPFNPSTTLRFDATADGHARLEVFDLRGRRVDVLLDATVTAGPHEVAWRPRGLAAGVYVARLSMAGAVARVAVALVE